MFLTYCEEKARQVLDRTGRRWQFYSSFIDTLSFSIPMKIVGGPKIMSTFSACTVDANGAAGDQLVLRLGDGLNSRGIGSRFPTGTSTPHPHTHTHIHRLYRFWVPPSLIHLDSGGSVRNGKVAGAWIWSRSSIWMREFIPPPHQYVFMAWWQNKNREHCNFAGESWLISLPPLRWTLLYILLFDFVRPAHRTALTPRLAGFQLPLHHRSYCTMED